MTAGMRVGILFRMTPVDPASDNAFCDTPEAPVLPVQTVTRTVRALFPSVVRVEVRSVHAHSSVHVSWVMTEVRARRIGRVLEQHMLALEEMLSDDVVKARVHHLRLVREGTLRARVKAAGWRGLFQPRLRRFA